jgi:hypothetical protein
MVAPHRTRVVLKNSKKNIAALIALARVVHDRMAADPGQFAAPVPPLATLLAQIQDLETAEQATKTRTKGTAALRDTKRDVLVTSLESQRMYVQTLCDASPDKAAALIGAAGMSVGQVPGGSKPMLRAKHGTQPGTVTLVANATLLVGKGVSKRPTFNWQMSADGGKTWTNLPSTPLASTDIANLTPATTYAFRVGVTVSKTTGEWSQAITLMVQ